MPAVLARIQSIFSVTLEIVVHVDHIHLILLPFGWIVMHVAVQ